MDPVDALDPAAPPVPSGALRDGPAAPAQGRDAGPPPEQRPGGQRSAEARPPIARRAGPSIRPALTVLAVAATIVLLFGIGAALTGNSPPARSPSPKKVVAGSGSLHARPATAALRRIELPGTPPPDVLDSLVVPAGATVVSAKPWGGETQYNGQVELRLAASQGSIIDFYRSELHSLGWSNFSTGAARGYADATEVLAERESTDGWYWEVGVVVHPTRFATGTRGPAETTRFSIDVFEVPDGT